MRVRIRLRKILFWGMFFLVTSLAGMIGFAYWYATDSDTLAKLIREGAPRYLRNAQLDPGRVRVRPFIGEISLSQLHIWQMIEKTNLPALRIPWLHIRVDHRAMFKGRFVPLKVEVAQPTLWLYRRKDGTWNVENLLMNPMPGPPMKVTPPIIIQNGTVNLVEGSDRKETAVLREVSIKIEPDGDDQLKFEGTAKGDASFERVNLQGTVDRATGKVKLTGDLSRLTVSENLRNRIPVECRGKYDKIGLKSGEIDVRIGQISYDPKATPRFRYEASAHLREGVLDCPNLPFPINQFSASVTVHDGALTIERADGNNGSTVVRLVKGQFAVGDLAQNPFDLEIQVVGLEFDKRLRDKTPPELDELWDVFRPQGRINASVSLVRDRVGGAVGCSWTIQCSDVGMTYKFFPYPVDHIQGVLSCEKNCISLDLRTVVGNKPLEVTGTINNPGDFAHVILEFEGGSLPIDKTLFDALPPPIRKVVDDFRPSGTVSGRARVERTRFDPTEPPEGKVSIDAWLDLNGDCSMKWVGMPYPVSNLTGRLELHPDLWTFEDMRGSNGQAIISGSGSVKKLPGNSTRSLPGDGDPLVIDLHLNAENIPFNQQLRDSLPPAWQKSWATLNPIGSSDVDAKIHLEPGKPEQYHLEIDPKPETLVQLKFTRERRSNIDPGGTFDLRMENVRGWFVYDNGLVKMRDVGFMFHGTPVNFASGWVKVEDSGQFQLRVAQVTARGFRMDGELRKMMPPVMAQFAHRLDEGRPIARINGNLGLSWPGPGQAVQCEWDHVLVVLADNKILAGVPLEHLQGQLDNVQGKFNGQELAVKGILTLGSISLMGQHVTDLETPFVVEKGEAELQSIRGKLLGGIVSGRFRVSLDSTPRYAAAVRVEGADLQSYAMTQPHKQSYRGIIYGNIELNGQGNDLHTLQGHGEAHITQGALGELPVVLRLANTLTLSAAAKTAFDSADIGITIQNGASVLDPIRLTGDAFSLRGKGNMDVQGDLDLRLSPVYGRDRIHLPFLSDAMREASGQLFVIRIQGPFAFPRFRLEALPYTSDAFRSLGSRRLRRDDRW